MVSNRVARVIAAAMVAGAVLSVGAGVFVSPPEPAVSRMLEDDGWDALALSPSVSGWEFDEAMRNHLWPSGEHTVAFCASPLRLGDRAGATTGRDPAGGLGRGDPVCTEELGDVDYRSVSAERSALTGVTVLAGTCRPEGGLWTAHVAFLARLARADEQLYDATFEWRIVDVLGGGVVRSRDLGQPVAISPGEPLVAGVPYQWRVRQTADPHSPVPWSEWFPYTLSC